MKQEYQEGQLKNLIRQIRQYKPCCFQEEEDRDVILEALLREPDILLRENRLAHMSASAWVVNRERTKVLMAYHNLYDSWSWLGGHADGEGNLLDVALREVREESGIVHVRPVSEEIFSLEVLTVDGHEKKGKYVSSHLHLNVIFWRRMKRILCRENRMKTAVSPGLAWMRRWRHLRNPGFRSGSTEN